MSKWPGPSFCALLRSCFQLSWTNQSSIFSFNLYEILERKDDHDIIPSDRCYDSKYQGITNSQLKRNFNTSPRKTFHKKLTSDSIKLDRCLDFESRELLILIFVRELKWRIFSILKTDIEIIISIPDFNPFRSL